MKDTLKSKLAVCLLKLAALLPQAVIHLLARLITFMLWHTKSATRRITQVNIKQCFPHKSAADCQSLAYESIKHTALTGLEMPSVLIRPPSESVAKISQVSNQNLIDEAMAEGNGVIIIAPHLGNWEYLGQHLAHYYPITNLYKPSKIKAIDDIIIKGRKSNGSNLMPTNKRGVMGLLKALKRGEMIGILPDQIPEEANGTVFAPFFAENAATMTLISNFIQRTQAKAFAAFAKRLEDGSFEIVYQAVDAALYDENLQSSVNALNRTIEKLVMAAPAQYQWEYKRFKKGENGSRRAMYQ